MVDVTDFLPPGYKLPEEEKPVHSEESIKETKKNYRISAPKEEEDESIKKSKKRYRISAPKLATSVSQHQPLLQRGKDVRTGLKPKEEPNEPKEVFFVVRQGRVLPSNKKTIYRRKYSRKHATTKEADFSTLIRNKEKINSNEGSLRSPPTPTNVQPKWKIKEASKADYVTTTEKASSIASTSTKTTAKNQPGPTTTTMTTIESTKMTTLLPEWKNKETERDLEAQWETIRKEKV